MFLCLCSVALMTVYNEGIGREREQRTEGVEDGQSGKDGTLLELGGWGVSQQCQHGGGRGRGESGLSVQLDVVSVVTVYKCPIGNK